MSVSMLIMSEVCELSGLCLHGTWDMLECKFPFPSQPAAAAKSLQSCLTLCDPIDSSPPGFPVSGILQARILEWVAISFFNAWKWKVKVKSLSRVQLLATPWTAAFQAPLPMGFSWQEYWSGLPLPSPFFSTYSLTMPASHVSTAPLLAPLKTHGFLHLGAFCYMGTITSMVPEIQ